MNQAAEQAVAVLVSRRVKPGHVADFERLCRQLMAVTADFQGHLGASLVQPGKLLALCVNTAKRSVAMTQVPTLAEAGLEQLIRTRGIKAD